MKKLLLYLSLGLVIFSAPMNVLAEETKAPIDNIKATSENKQMPQIQMLKKKKLIQIQLETKIF